MTNYFISERWQEMLVESFVEWEESDREDEYTLEKVFQSYREWVKANIVPFAHSEKCFTFKDQTTLHCLIHADDHISYMMLQDFMSQYLFSMPDDPLIDPFPIDNTSPLNYVDGSPDDHIEENCEEKRDGREEDDDQIKDKTRV